MRHCYIILLFVISCSIRTSAHDFYFSFCEIAYNEISQQLEATLIVTTHDFEKYLETNALKDKSLSEIYVNEKEKLEKIINKHLQLSTNDQDTIYFTLDGIESQLTGASHIYLSAHNIEPFNQLIFMFDLLMDYFPEQQNKLTFIHRGKKDTFVFLPGHEIAELILDKR